MEENRDLNADGEKPKRNADNITESPSGSLSSSEALEDAEKDNIEHKAYHFIIAREMAKRSDQKHSKNRRLFRLAQRWLIYTTSAAHTISIFSKLKCRDIYFTPSVKKALLESINNKSDYDEELIEKFAEEILQEESLTTPAIEIYRSAYNVYHAGERKLIPKASKNTLNEWTLMIDTIVELVKAYITTYCKTLFDIEYDKTIDGGKTRPDFKLYLDGDVSLPILVCEVAKEPMQSGNIVMVHKDGSKLPTTMQQLLREQLCRVPIDKAGMFGILVGQFDVRVLFMNAECHQELWAFPMAEVNDFTLKHPSGYHHLFNFMAQVEAFALELQKNVQHKELVRNFPTFPGQPESGRRTATSSTPSKKSSNQQKDKSKGQSKSNSRGTSNLGSKDRQQSSLQQQLLPNLEGVLEDEDSLGEDCYSAVWKNQDVFIITKTACNAQEIEFLQEVKCKTIIQLLHSEINSQDEDEVTYTLVLPMLEKYYATQGGLVNHLRFARDILEAMHHLHQKNIVHRDIKPSNIGLALDDTWILFDFNNATRLLEENNFKSFTEGVGTEGYQAPEVLEVDPDEGYDCKVDIYSFGKVLMKMCENPSSPIKHMIDLCLKEDPAQRPDASALLEYVQATLDKLVKYRAKKAAKIKETTKAEEVLVA